MQERLGDVLGSAPGEAESDDEAFRQVRERVQALISAARTLSDTCADLADALRPAPGLVSDDPIVAGFGRLRAERTAALLDEAASAARGTLGLLHSAVGALDSHWARVGSAARPAGSGTWPDAFVEVPSRTFTVDDEAGTTVAQRPWARPASMSPDATDPHGIPAAGAAPPPVALEPATDGTHQRPATDIASGLGESAGVMPATVEATDATADAIDFTPVGISDAAAAAPVDTAAATPDALAEGTLGITPEPSDTGVTAADDPLRAAPIGDDLDDSTAVGPHEFAGGARAVETPSPPSSAATAAPGEPAETAPVGSGDEPNDTGVLGPGEWAGAEPTGTAMAMPAVETTNEPSDTARATPGEFADALPAAGTADGPSDTAPPAPGEFADALPTVSTADERSETALVTPGGEFAGVLPAVGAVDEPSETALAVLGGESADGGVTIGRADEPTGTAPAYALPADTAAVEQFAVTEATVTGTPDRRVEALAADADGGPGEAAEALDPGPGVADQGESAGVVADAAYGTDRGAEGALVEAPASPMDVTHLRGDEPDAGPDDLDGEGLRGWATPARPRTQQITAYAITADGDTAEEAGTVGEHTRDDIEIQRPTTPPWAAPEYERTPDDVDGEGLRGWAAPAHRAEVAAAALAGWIVVDPDDADDPGHPIPDRAVAAAPSVDRLTLPVPDPIPQPDPEPAADRSPSSLDAMADTAADTGLGTAPDRGLGTAADTHLSTATDTGLGTAADTGLDTVRGAGLDVATDSAGDTTEDTGLDTAADAGLDTAADAGLDAGTGRGLDAGTDTGFDAGTGTRLDAAADTALAMAADTGPDAGMDTGFGTGADTGRDAAADTGLDAAADIGLDAAADIGLDAAADGARDADAALGTAPIATLDTAPITAVGVADAGAEPDGPGWHGDSVSAEPRSLSLVPPVPDESDGVDENELLMPAAADRWTVSRDWTGSDFSGAAAFAQGDRSGWVPGTAPATETVFPISTPAPAAEPEKPLDEPAGAVLARQVEAARRHLQAALVVANGPAAPQQLGGLLTAIEQVLTAVTDLARETRGLLESGLGERTFPGEARFLCSVPWEGTNLVGRDAYGDDVATPAGLAKLLRALGYEAHSVTSAGGVAGVQIHSGRYAMQVALVEPAGGGRQRWSGALEWVDESGASRTWAETLGPVDLEDEELARRVDELLRRSIGG